MKHLIYLAYQKKNNTLKLYVPCPIAETSTWEDFVKLSILLNHAFLYWYTYKFSDLQFSFSDMISSIFSGLRLLFDPSTLANIYHVDALATSEDRQTTRV